MRALIFAGGSAPGLGHHEIPTADLVIAADSGLHHALDLGLDVDLIVGDLDSADRDRVDAAVTAGAQLLQYPAAKDQTDLELALGIAVENGAQELVVVGALGGRLDHLLANTALLASSRWAEQSVELLDASARLWVVRDTRRLDVEANATVSLLAVGGPAVVTTSGFRWDLSHHQLVPGTSLGVSNVATTVGPSVTVQRGVVVAITTPVE